MIKPSAGQPWILAVFRRLTSVNLPNFSCVVRLNNWPQFSVAIRSRCSVGGSHPLERHNESKGGLVQSPIRSRCSRWRKSSSLQYLGATGSPPLNVRHSLTGCRVHGRERARTLFSGNKVNISPNKRNAFVLCENYTEGVKVFTLTAYRNDQSSTARISVGDFWRRNADGVNSALWTD
jgi:hypothetical protein